VLFTNLISKIGVNGFARGTAFAPGGMALVGEKGPELVNIPRGSQVISNMRTNRLLEGMGQSGGVMQGEFTVRGTDLVLVLDRAKARQSRVF
jgi:phage-related tail protein